MSRSLTLLSLLFLLFFRLPSEAEAQGGTEKTFELWNALVSTAALGEEKTGPSLWLDAHARRGRANTVVILRPGAGYRLSSWASVWVGYAWIPVFSDVQGRRTHEHRLWQQLTLTHRPNSELVVQSRSRFEQRFLGGQGSDVRFRFREFVRANWHPKRSPAGLAVWDELFIGLNDADWGPSAGYDQNRLFVGLLIPLSSKARMEPGYLLVHLKRSPNVVAHNFALNFFVNH